MAGFNFKWAHRRITKIPKNLALCPQYSLQLCGLQSEKIHDSLINIMVESNSSQFQLGSIEDARE